MTFKEATDKINSLLKFGTKPGLNRIKTLLDMMHNPQKKLKFIHVGGTNGKGSTCAFISSVLKEAGFKTGLFTSPFVLDLRERIQINSSAIPKGDFTRIIDSIFPFVESMSKENKIITEFELLTAIAFKWFYEQNCDIVVLETGMGGRLDSTNVIEKPLISVITSISLDHTNILGSNIEKIAFEKAGIIKKNCPVVLYPKQRKNVMNIIKTVANNRGSRLIIPDFQTLKFISSDMFGTNFTYKNIKFNISLLGRHQVNNAIVSFAAINALINMGYTIPLDCILSGLKNAYLPARLEILNTKPVVILDGAHNEDSIAELSDFIREKFANKRLVGIIGLLSDKDIDSIIKNIAHVFDDIITVTPNSKRAFSAVELAKKIRQYNQNTHVLEHSLKDALITALHGNPNDLVVVIFGSFYLAADIRPIAIELLKNIGI